jgi:hypothetical protein
LRNQRKGICEIMRVILSFSLKTPSPLTSIALSVVQRGQIFVFIVLIASSDEK